ncbi:hypothetical protein FACS1894142_4110 [Spirochaetia bacterium]|nr:hypothetical protein FACS1894142_4110 [Spirochaetia bacterium]
MKRLVVLLMVLSTVFMACELFTGPAGEPGEKGDTGATGAQGAKGDKGDTGEQGIPGQNGSDGITPEIKGGTWWIGSVNTGIPATGPQGIAGTNGTDGAKGDKGDTGAAGTNGTNGTDGAKGDKGDTGSAGTNGTNGTDGAKGDKGDAGTNGIDGLSWFILPGAYADAEDVPIHTHSAEDPNDSYWAFNFDGVDYCSGIRMNGHDSTETTRFSVVYNVYPSFLSGLESIGYTNGDNAYTMYQGALNDTNPIKDQGGRSETAVRDIITSSHSAS